MASVTLGIQSLGIVGESHHQRSLKMLSKLRVQLFAELIAEPQNPYDRHAVRVDIWHGPTPHTVGHLARGNAPKFQGQILAAWQQGNRVVIPAQIMGGTRDQPSFGVWIGERYWTR